MPFWQNCFASHQGYQQIAAVNGVTAHSGPHFGVRHWQCFLLFFGLGIAYALRVNLSVAIVAMTDRNATNPDFEEYNWNEGIKSYLLSSFFWGYVMTQIPGGYLSHHYGAKFILFFGVLTCSLLAVLTPVCAHIGNWQLVLWLRAAQGFSQGMIFPSTHTFLSKWSPANERGRLVTICYSGAQFGTVVMLSVSGYIASSRLGWPSIFYLSGVVGIIWCLVWFYFSASSPAQHPSITVNELNYIESSISVRRNSTSTSPSAIVGQPTLPWCKIITSPAFLTLLLVHCGNNWGFWTLLTEIPSYMKNILGMDIRNNGPLSALPYLAMGLLSFSFIYLAGFLNRLRFMTLNFSRKLFNTIGLWVPMFALFGLCYVTAADSTILAVTLLTIAVATNAATYLGFQVNHIDLSPNFAGTLMGMTNCVANIMSIIAPLVVGLIVTDEKNPAQWRIIFFITAGIYFLSNLLFLVYGRTNIQSWNNTVRTRRSSDSDFSTTETEPLQSADHT